MHSWEIVCIEVDQDSEFNDCRAISKLGYKAPTLNEDSADSVGAKIHQGHCNYHIMHNGERIQLKAGRDPPDVFFYARTLEEDSPDDPLLSLKQCQQYKMENKLSEL